MIWLFLLLMAATAFGLFGAWICGEKGRSRNTGALIGFVFGPIGVLILALLPNKEAPARPTASRRPPVSNRPPASAFQDDIDDRALRFLNEASDGPKKRVDPPL